MLVHLHRDTELESKRGDFDVVAVRKLGGKDELHVA